MAASWLKRGSAAKDLEKREKQKQAERKEEYGKLRRWFLDPNESGKMTFIDGALDSDGVLDPPRVYEHFYHPPGSQPRNFVCPEQTEPDSGAKCPLCEMGNQASLVSFFTIIDHRSYKADNGTVYVNQRRLLAVKPTVFEKLNKKAIMRGGLVGTTWEVSRATKKVAATGDDFDFIEKVDPKILIPKYLMEVKDATGKVTGKTTAFVVADYEKEINYKNEEQLRQMGFGSGTYTGTPTASTGPVHNSSGDGFVSSGGGTPVDPDTAPADESSVEYNL